MPWRWSTEASENDTIDPTINWSEGQAPSTVNNSARAMMARLAGAVLSTDFAIETLADLATTTVPTGVTRLRIRKYDADSLVTNAWYTKVDDDPDVPMSGQDAEDNWWVLDEALAEPEMAGALGDNTGNDAPAFSRLLQSGDRKIIGRTGAIYRLAKDAVYGLAAIHNNNVAFNHITLDLEGCRLILDCDDGVNSYASFIEIAGSWTRFTLIGGECEYSTPPFLQGIVAEAGVGSTADDAWFTFTREAEFEHPGWDEDGAGAQSIRIIDRYNPDTRLFRGRISGWRHSDVTGTGQRNTAGFPLTRPDPSGAPTVYKVDLQNAKPNLAKAIEMRDRLGAGNLVGVQHRRDIANAINVNHSAQGASRFDHQGTTIYHAAGRAVRPLAVGGGSIDNIKVIRKRSTDFYSVNPGGYRLQECYGEWHVGFMEITDCGDDALMSYGRGHKILAVPPTGGLGANQLLILSSNEISKPQVGDRIEAVDAATGVPDRDNVRKATVIGEGVSSWILTLDDDVPAGWTISGAAFVPGEDDDEEVDDGTTSPFLAPVDGHYITARDTGPDLRIRKLVAHRNRGSALIGAHFTRLQADMIVSLQNTKKALVVGNPYPGSLNGPTPGIFDVTVLTEDTPLGNGDGMALIGGYSGNTRDNPAAVGAVLGGHIHILEADGTPGNTVRLNGCDGTHVIIDSLKDTANNPNFEVFPNPKRTVYGSNCANVVLMGTAVQQFTPEDVLFDGTNTNNVVVAPRTRNWLANAGFERASKGTTIVVPNSATGIIAFDRWKAARTATGMTVSRQAGFNGARYALRVQRDSGNESVSPLFIGQQIPTVDMRQLAGKEVMLVFEVRGGADYSGDPSGDPGGQVRTLIVTGTGEDEVWTLSDAMTGGFTGGVGTILNPTPRIVPDAAGTIKEYFSLKHTIPANATEGAIRLANDPMGTAGAADYYEVVNLRLIEVGTGFTIFPRTYDEEVNSTRWFFERIGGEDADYHFASGFANTTTSAVFTLTYDEKRAIPTVTVNGTVGTDFEVFRAGSAVVAPTAIVASEIGRRSCLVTVTVASGLTAGEGLVLKSATTSGVIDISAEL